MINMERNEKIHKAVINAITGDALGSTLEGFTPEHIKAVYKTISEYTDPEPALKNKLENWRKPGLYTSISQLMLLLSASFGKGRFNPDGFINKIKSSPDIENSRTGIFRHTDYILNRYITGLKSNQILSADFSSSVKLIPACLPFSLQNYHNDSDIYSQFKFCTSFTSDPYSISACLIFTCLIHRIINSENFMPENALPEAGKSAELILEYSEKNSSRLFDLKLNPDNISNSSDFFLKLFESLGKADSEENGSKIIIENLNYIFKYNIKKISIAHPAAAFPAALIKFKNYSETETLLIECAKLGGPASSMAAIAGALSGAAGNSFDSDSFLSKNLINRKHIANLAYILSGNSRDSFEIDEFYKSEANLTKKEIEEYHSRLKHYKKPEKTVKNIKSIEERMAQHIVESWTKTDKAKWKKEKKNIKKEYEESDN